MAIKMKMKVASPVGEPTVKLVHPAPRLDTLNGKTICMLHCYPILLLRFSAVNYPMGTAHVTCRMAPTVPNNRRAHPDRPIGTTTLPPPQAAHVSIAA